MAANTKYTPAPQRDSFEEQQAAPQYSQAPPSYQAEPLLGTPRGEDDNVPDDFKVREIPASGVVCENSGGESEASSPLHRGNGSYTSTHPSRALPHHSHSYFLVHFPLTCHGLL